MIHATRLFKRAFPGFKLSEAITGSRLRENTPETLTAVPTGLRDFSKVEEKSLGNLQRSRARM